MSEMFGGDSFSEGFEQIDKLRSVTELPADDGEASDTEEEAAKQRHPSQAALIDTEGDSAREE